MKPHNPQQHGVVAVITRESRLLVIRRAVGVVAAGKLCFPGGAIEEGESEEDALCREFVEELGATIRPLRRLWQSVTPWQVAISWWEAELLHDELRANPAEVEEFLWLRPEEIRELPDILESNVDFLNALDAGRFQLDRKL